MIKFVWLLLLTGWSVLITGQSDSLSNATLEESNLSSYQLDSTHSPKKATILSAFIPGGGQIYNNFYKPKNRKSRLWWKLPLIYGGMGTGIYFVFENHRQFQTFRSERLDLLEAYQTNGDTYSANGYTDAQLQSIATQYERWRDLSAIGTLAVYLLNIIDANVEGTLLHFDSSDDLSFDIHPLTGYIAQQKYFGASLSLSF